MEWLVENWDDLLLALGALHTVASVVTKLTPSPKDDEWLAKVWGFFSVLPSKGVRGVKAPFTSLKPEDRS
jgi:hypothetical protein